MSLWGQLELIVIGSESGDVSYTKFNTSDNVTLTSFIFYNTYMNNNQYQNQIKYITSFIKNYMS